MSAPILYTGPGKVVMMTVAATVGAALSADGENGEVKLEIMEKRTKRYTANNGYLRSTLDDQQARITITPFDSWALLPKLYPAYLGITTNTTTAGLLIGTRPHDSVFGTVTANGLAHTKIWTPDGRLYDVVRTGTTKHPGMKLGVGHPLYTGMEITGLWDPAGNFGTLASTAFLAITESGATDPDAGNFTVDFINGHWTGVWGSVTGFTTLDSEDGWDLMVDAKYSPITCSKRTFHYKLDSVEIMIKARLAGPTHTQLAGKILAHTLGGVLYEGSATTLQLTGPGGKTITLNDCEVYLEGQGFEFGGAKLGTGEVAFVSQVDFTSGLPTAALTFSA